VQNLFVFSDRLISC